MKKPPELEVDVQVINPPGTNCYVGIDNDRDDVIWLYFEQPEGLKYVVGFTAEDVLAFSDMLAVTAEDLLK